MAQTYPLVKNTDLVEFKNLGINTDNVTEIYTAEFDMYNYIYDNKLYMTKNYLQASIDLMMSTYPDLKSKVTLNQFIKDIKSVFSKGNTISNLTFNEALDYFIVFDLADDTSSYRNISYTDFKDTEFVNSLETFLNSYIENTSTALKFSTVEDAFYKDGKFSFQDIRGLWYFDTPSKGSLALCFIDDETNENGKIPHIFELSKINDKLDKSVYFRIINYVNSAKYKNNLKMTKL